MINNTIVTYHDKSKKRKRKNRHINREKGTNPTRTKFIRVQAQPG